jgi:large subunit ribosomal protein L18
MAKKSKLNKRDARRNRVRAKVKGTNERPRLSVFRSNRHIFAQIINDLKGKTIASASDLKISKKDNIRKTDIAKNIGIELAKKAKEKKIKAVVFDRGGYKYHGRVKAIAEGAREAGLKF